MPRFKIFEPWRPVLGSPEWDGGGREVIVWRAAPCHRRLRSWAALLIDRNMHGCLPFDTNPEPWPGYYWPIENSEISHSRSPWYWGKPDSVNFGFPFASKQQIKDALSYLRLLNDWKGILTVRMPVCVCV